jgi:hypothetical protein
MIFLDHTSFLPIADYTLQRFSFLDAAELFVFISGLVTGLVYTRVLLAGGLQAALRKALRRCGQLYRAHLLLTAASLTLLGAYAARGVFLNDSALYRFWHGGWETFLYIAGLLHAPGALRLLPVYILFVGLAPLALALWRKKKAWVVAGGLGLYAAARGGLEMPAYPWGAPWSFNPFAWQVVFLGGLLLGCEAAGRGGTLDWRPGKKLLAAALLGLAVIAVVELSPSPRFARLLGTDFLMQNVPDLPWRDKRDLGPLRVLNLALLVVAAAAVPRRFRLLRSAVARPFLLLGRSSLAVFCVGVWFNLLAALAVKQAGGDLWMGHIFTWAGIAAMLLAAALRERTWQCGGFRREPSYTPLSFLRR